MKKLIIAGNWKMNTNAKDTINLINGIKEQINKITLNKNIEIIVCPPFINIEAASNAIENSIIKLGAQNCHYESKGAYTGEISTPMLKYFNCEYCIVGHSERRQYFNEANQFINLKIKALLNDNLKPILCIGETLQERQNKFTFEILKNQLDESLAELKDEQMSNIIIAYEPIWAIGTGVTANAEQIYETHNYLRNYLVQQYPINGKNIIIQYGGSVNEKNAKEIFGIENVNGALVGGASLKVEQFISIINSGNEL